MNATETKPTTTNWQPTACILCSLNCGLEVQVEDRHITRIRGNRAHPASQGYTCEKPQRLDYYQNAADRLTSPLRRRADGTFEAIDWETAIAEITERFLAIKAQHGGETILYYGGGGQGNHLGGAYADSTLKALGNRYRSNALAQEKTGEFWVQGKMMGTGVHGDFEHCEAAVFVGKNPWQSHGFARARITLKEIAKDPNRSLIVIDPRRSETAELADYHLAIKPGTDACVAPRAPEIPDPDYHLAIKPGTDAWCLAALVAILMQENLIARDWLSEHATGLENIEPLFAAISVADYAEACGVSETQLRSAARRIAQASSVSMMEDLGMQMSVHSTLGSYLQRLIWLLTGNFGRLGTNYAFAPLIGLTSRSKGDSVGQGDAKPVKQSPVAGARIIGGLIPCNVIPEEILTDHPARYRAMLIESGNPAHSLADSQRMREALNALELLVVIDVAMTETARLAHYVLPAASQFEKYEATFSTSNFRRTSFTCAIRCSSRCPAHCPNPKFTRAWSKHWAC
jgi:anaerobic selenocysteine-containing dehydrogenase